MKWTNSEIQKVIDDLDYARAFFPEKDEDGRTNDLEMRQVRRSLENASDILTDLPVETLEALDKRREVYLSGRRR